MNDDYGFDDVAFACSRNRIADISQAYEIPAVNSFDYYSITHVYTKQPLNYIPLFLR